MNNNRRKVFLTVTTIFFIIFFLKQLSLTYNYVEASETFNESDLISDQQLQLTILLEEIYLDGEVSERHVLEEVNSLEQLSLKYKDWNFVGVEGETIILQRHVDDISPLLKANGYFGISNDGSLTIFNGKPNINNVIQSFFQIDVERLESKHYEKLKDGIPINDRNNYVDVIEAFQSYSTN